MTKKELAEKIAVFVAMQDNDSCNEWYCTQQELYGDILEEFLSFINQRTPRTSKKEPK